MNLDVARPVKNPLDVIDHKRFKLRGIEYSSAGEQQAYLFKFRNR